ncbi:helix-turn-helix domain-containing protein [Streptomyces glycanivorans]|uniref:Helix-turn-helix domain-containing protein n=1 Tax=Streptomyces glycanivorans TaxID=3033808 RepID=A0ABY9JS10_9ACTN|nr:helix-turn-helix domain-containing protein [Streptomyces sp. Alt3]WLQ69344.1 helix-turn-helix domain-containing protein [Streptomyces sp. Alt3]
MFRRQPVSRSARPGTWAELDALRAWMREVKGELTFPRLAFRARQFGRPVAERTLRRALQEGLPGVQTVRAYAWGSRKATDNHAREALEETGLRLREAAQRAAPVPARTWPAPVYVPGRVRTWPGLTRALNRLRLEAGEPPVRALAASCGAAGRLSKSTISNLLNGQHPTVEQLAALAAALGASPAATDALLAAHRRITAGPRPPAVYPCDVVDRAEEEREDRREQEEKRRRFRGIPEEKEVELDPYDQQLREEEEAEHRRRVAWVDGLSADELAALQRQSVAGAGRDLHAELTAYVARICPGR